MAKKRSVMVDESVIKDLREQSNKMLFKLRDANALLQGAYAALPDGELKMKIARFLGLLREED